MSSRVEIIDAEIQRRRENIESLKQNKQSLVEAIEQFNELDEMYRSDEDKSRKRLECIYKENRHFTGEQPLVYQSSTVEKRPLFKETDAECNPYFPISKVKDETFDGISPLFASPTRTGAYTRQNSYSPTEDAARGVALSELQAFPDISNEPLPPGWPGSQETNNTGSAQCYYASGGDQTTCETNGGEWVLDGELIPDPTWVGSETAPALLRTALESWKSDIQNIQADLCEDGTAEFDYWQGVVDDIDIVLPAVANDAEFVRDTGNNDPAAWGQTQDFANGSAEDLARDRLITAADTGVQSHVSNRKSFLNDEADTEENIMFGIIKLRLHQVNGSFSKLSAAKEQLENSDKFIQDHLDAIASLNEIKASIS